MNGNSLPLAFAIPASAGLIALAWIVCGTEGLKTLWALLPFLVSCAAYAGMANAGKDSGSRTSLPPPPRVGDDDDG